MKKNLLFNTVILIVSLVFPTLVKAQIIYTGADLDINNVRSRINNELSLFWDPVSQSPQYEIPKGSGNTTIYAGSLWIGGIDPQGNLHMSAQTYKQNSNEAFYPGPLDTSNATAADPNIWNHIWKVNKSEIDNHIANWNTQGYVIPASIANWPGNAPAGSNYNPILAPFFDSNGNGIYEPALGEFPAISGDQAIYFICNDNYAVSALGVPAMGLEIHGMAYAFNRPNDPAMNNTIFLNLQIANYSGINYHDVYLGLWTDMDVGNAQYNYACSDVGRNMAYVYDSLPSTGGYNPAQGLKFLSPDMKSMMSYENITNVPNGVPNTGFDFYHYCSAIWKDSIPLTFGGNGRGAGGGATSTPAKYMFPGTSDSTFSGQNWSMITAGIPANDIRTIQSTGAFSILAGSHVSIDLANITAFPSGTLSAVDVLDGYADDLAARYLNGTLTAVTEIKPATSNSIKLSPSLVENQLSISFEKTHNTEYSVEIFSTDGKMILVKNNLRGNTMLNLSTLSSGMYIVRVHSEDGDMEGRIVKK